jgi:hypothetical protein
LQVISLYYATNRAITVFKVAISSFWIYDLSMTITELTIELSKAKERLTYCLDAEERILRGGQRFIFEDGDMRRTVDRADLGIVGQRVNYWRSVIADLERQIASGGRKAPSYLVVR